MTTTTDIQATMKAGFTTMVKERLALNGKSDWKQADSVAALLSLAEALHDAFTTIDGAEMAEGAEALTSGHAEDMRNVARLGFSTYANDLANPSAFRQWLTAKKLITPSATPTKGGSAKADLVSALA